MTLELGIDIGHLNRIIQIGAPYSCSSFLQRLGRSGRRSGTAEMFFCHLEEVSNNDNIFYSIPWSLLQMIAIIQLYSEEKWVEPTTDKSLPFSLLYHQTMSVLTSMGELTAAALARNVLSLHVFRNITQEQQHAYSKQEIWLCMATLIKDTF